MLSRSGIHAIRAMVELATQASDQYCGVASIAQSTDSPQNYLGKLLQQLSRRGLVESRKGLGGGFRLAKAPAQISLLDIIASIDDVGRWTECPLTGGACPQGTPCTVHARWTRAREALLSFLRDTNIAELAAAHRPQTDDVGYCACERPAITHHS